LFGVGWRVPKQVFAVQRALGEDRKLGEHLWARLLRSGFAAPIVIDRFAGNGYL
jgi:hypothetical protein